MARRTDLDGISSLWKEYKETKDVEIRNKLVEKYLKLVKYIAEKVKAKLPYSIELDDLISAGVFGLMEAIDAFDFSRDIRFETYCVYRIRGAMLDELRKMDWVPRLVRRQASKWRRAMKAIGNNNGNGHAPTLKEIADYFGISIEDAKKIEVQGNTPIVHFCQMANKTRGEDWEDEFKDSVDLNQIADTKTIKPENGLSKDEGFLELISCLSKREQIIVTLYHRDDFQMWRIGEVLDVCESRVSQMYSNALQKIKDSLTF